MSAERPILKAIDVLRNHRFVEKMEWLLDLPARRIEYKYPPESGKLPSIKIQYNVAPETMKTCEEVVSLVHRIRNVLHTLQKLDSISSTLEAIDFGNNIKQGAEEFEFQIQNYYLRITTVLDQVYELVSILCEIKLIHSNYWQYDRLVSQSEPELGQVLSEFSTFMRPAKELRNFAAHLGEFADDDYDTISHFLQFPDEAFSFIPILQWLETYRKILIPQCRTFLSEAIHYLNIIFDMLLPIANARYKEETTANGTIELRKANAP